MLYNNICTTCASAMLFGPDVPRRGDRFVFAMSTGDRFGAFSSISIYQTGDVPSTARSIMFATDANFDFSLWHISLGGQQLYFQDLGEADLMDPDFPFPGKAYGADVSLLAGQTAELRFTAFPSPSGIQNGERLDNLRFSSNPLPAIPEPSTWALLGTGVAALAWHHRRGRRRG